MEARYMDCGYMDCGYIDSGYENYILSSNDRKYTPGLVRAQQLSLLQHLFAFVYRAGREGFRISE